MLTQSGWHALGDTGLSAFSIRATMSFARMRVIAGAVCVAALLFAAPSAPAQTTDAKPPDPRAQTPDKDGQRKPDEFAEAARLLGGPAAFPECVWLGRRVVSLLWRDDLDTAFRHLDLYDRFSCPSGHIQATFAAWCGREASIPRRRRRSAAACTRAGSIRPGTRPRPARPLRRRRRPRRRGRPAARLYKCSACDLLYKRSRQRDEISREQFCSSLVVAMELP